MMWFSADPTGFPLIEVADVGVKLQLLPVTKLQFERFLAASNDYWDSWYEEVLAGNPPISYQHFQAEERERLFLTGIRPEEALAFVDWMGGGYDLPTVEEWRAIYQALSAEPVMTKHLDWHISQIPAAAARHILQRLLEQLQPGSVLELSLMRGGLVEWVRQGQDWVGLGAPRPAFWPHLWDPLVDVLQPSRPGERLRHFGFRLLVRHG